MGKVLRWLKDRLPTQRRLIQLYAALLHNAHVKGFITGDIYTGNAKALCVPGLNCYSCPGAAGACPLGALQNAIVSSGARTPAYVLGILLLFGLTLGRTICGFLCPAGLMQELLHKLPTPKVKKGRLTRALTWVKYGILAVFVIALPLWYAQKSLPLPAFCKYICPAGTVEGAVGLLSHPANADKVPMLGQLFTSKFLILVIIAAACVFIYRAFCRFLCPLGAIYGLFAKVAVIGVKVDMPKCVDCGRCVSHCRMDVRHVGDHECIHCGECIGVCPTKAISFKAGKIVLHGPQIDAAPAQTRARVRSRRHIAWGIALAALALVLVICNLPSGEEPAAIAPAVEDGLPVGSRVGMRAPDFTVPLYGPEGGTFTLSEHRGKTDILNFWATWCNPCVAELPHFAELQRSHPQEVTVICVHSELVTDDVERFLSGHDYGMYFALDAEGTVFPAYDGSTMLPQTIVISPDGIITHNAVGSVTYPLLEALLAASQEGAQPTPTTAPQPTAAPLRQPLPGFGR